MLTQHTLRHTKRSDLPLLTFLAGEPLDGYRLSTLRAVGPGFLRGGAGRVYPALHRLEQLGLLAGEWSVAPDGRRRRLYLLTANGRRVLGLLPAREHHRRTLLGAGLLFLGGALVLFYSVVAFLASLLLLTPGLLLLIAGAALLGKPPNSPSPPAACGPTMRLHPLMDEPAVTPTDVVPPMRVPLERSE